MVQDDHTLKESNSVFVIRYGSVSMTFGSTVRRQLSMESDQKQLVHTFDACHLSIMHRGTFGNIVSSLPNNQTLLDTFSVDANNESSSFWIFCLHVRKNAIKSRLSSPINKFLYVIN